MYTSARIPGRGPVRIDKEVVWYLRSQCVVNEEPILRVPQMVQPVSAKSLGSCEHLATYRLSDLRSRRRTRVHIAEPVVEIHGSGALRLDEGLSIVPIISKYEETIASRG